MIEENTNENTDDETTGLPWPTSWRGAYILVAASFALWLTLLVMLGSIGQ